MRLSKKLDLYAAAIFKVGIHAMKPGEVRALRHDLRIPLTPRNLRVAHARARDLEARSVLVAVGKVIKTLDEIGLETASIYAELQGSEPMSTTFSYINNLRQDRKFARIDMEGSPPDPEQHRPDPGRDLRPYAKKKEGKFPLEPLLLSRPKLRKAAVDPDEIHPADEGMVSIHSYDPPSVLPREDKGRHDLRMQLARRKWLVGPTQRHDIDILYAGLHERSPWLAPLTTEAWHMHLSAAGQGALGLRLEPLLLVGPPGCGKTHWTSDLALLAGVEHVRIDMSARRPLFAIAGSDHVYRNASPGDIVALLARSVAANPIVVLDEIDKASRVGEDGDPINVLLPLLQGDTARTFTCPFVQAQVDFSHINFVATANSIDGLPAALLDRFTVMRAEPPRGEALSLFIAKFMGDLADHSVRSEIVSLVEDGDLSLRDLGRLRDRFDFIFRSPTLQ